MLDDARVEIEDVTTEGELGLRTPCDRSNDRDLGSIEELGRWPLDSDEKARDGSEGLVLFERTLDVLRPLARR